MSGRCREALDNPNRDGPFSVTGGRDDPNPDWCDCLQGECAYAYVTPTKRRSCSLSDSACNHPECSCDEMP